MVDWKLSLDWVYDKLKSALKILGDIDKEISEGKKIIGFAKFLTFTILVMVIISSIIYFIWIAFAATNNFFMKLVAGIIIVLFIFLIICAIIFLIKKFINKEK